MALLTLDTGGRWEVSRSQDTPIVFSVQIDGANVTPSGATLGVYDGSTLLASPSVTPASGSMSATVTSASLASQELGTFVTLSLSFTAGGEARRWQANVLVVDALDFPGCTLAALYSLYPALSGCVPSGQTTWAPQIEAAWVKLKADLSLVPGAAPGLSPSKQIIRELHEALAIQIIGGVLLTSQGLGVTWEAHRQAAMDRYKSLMSQVKLVIKERGSVVYPCGATLPEQSAQRSVSLRGHDPYARGRM